MQWERIYNRRNLVVSLAEEGKSLQEIVDITGVSRVTISQDYKRRTGKTFRQRKHYILTARQQQALDLFQKGYTMRSIADTLGICIQRARILVKVAQRKKKK